MIIGVVLARGGSKRIPGKNKKLLGPLPLVAWTIVVARYAAMLDGLVVSSDDPEILDIARQHNAHALLRPDDLASDEASSYAALLHAVDQCDGYYRDVCLLQPTSPFRTAWDIDVCCKAQQERVLPAAVSCQEGRDVPNGAVYVGEIGWLRDGGSFDNPDATIKHFMPRETSLDIDTPEDWAQAERLIAERECRTSL